MARRAAVHRALGDPGRLAIVDALVGGDMSPSVLAAGLGMASNLFSHHVDVLVEAGVVRRIRSEGDRRRSYLSLVASALDGLNPAADLAAPRVVFVCTENAARSQLAAALWAVRSDVPTASAGTHPSPVINPGAIAAARRHQLALVPSPPRHVEDVLRPDDVVITVCDRAHEELPPGAPHTHWSVADPARSDTDDAFDTALSELQDRITRLAPTLRPA